MRRLFTIAACAALGACATSDPLDTLDPPDEVRTAGLGGTAWRLVEIQSMDDQSYAPGDGVYTIEFDAESRVAMRIDCNRGRAFYFASEDGALSFGPLALTRRQCPEGSLHDRFLTQLGFVRSYVLEGGRLYLATLADGAILEFEPVASGQ